MTAQVNQGQLKNAATWAHSVSAAVQSPMIAVQNRINTDLSDLESFVLLIVCLHAFRDCLLDA